MHSRTIETPAGRMTAVADDAGLRMFEFGSRTDDSTLVRLKSLGVADSSGDLAGKHIAAACDQIYEYFESDRREFDLKLAPVGTEFDLEVWHALLDVKFGETRSYADLARAIGRPTATRAVARANGRNRIPIIIPCHRVIGADGSLTGYGGGLDRKRMLLELESNSPVPAFAR